MNIQFFGAAQTVTGSKHLITTESGFRILLDCGLFQGIGTTEQNQEFGFDPAQVDVLLLSHAHIDHCGLIPRLIRQGFQGDIYCTPATKDLAEVLLMDSARIQESDLQRVNKRRKHRNEPTLEPLYELPDVEETSRHFKPVEYHKTFFLAKGVSACFYDAGHLLGSASIFLTIQEGDKETKLWFTGDIGRPSDKILRSPETVSQADYILCESTYGDRLHEPEPDMKRHLLDIVLRTCVERKGKVIIPAFAVDRTQELIYTLDQLSNEGLLPKLPVYVDSPLSVKATQVIRDHEECFNPDILSYIKKDGDAFEFQNLHYVTSVEDSKAINDYHGPCIIISSSGMAEAGRIKHHIKNNCNDSRNTVLLVGYCSPNSLGGALKRGDKQVKIFGEQYEVKCQVEVMDSFSAHADYAEIIHFLKEQNPAAVKTLFLVHGELPVQEIFKAKLQKLGYQHIEIPSFRSRFQL
ncbi:MAG: MBL fold metallo-hydrolase [Siphonobacter sp.]